MSAESAATVLCSLETGVGSEDWWAMEQPERPKNSPKKSRMCFMAGVNAPLEKRIFKMNKKSERRDPRLRIPFLRSRPEVRAQIARPRAGDEMSTHRISFIGEMNDFTLPGARRCPRLFGRAMRCFRCGAYPQRGFISAGSWKHRLRFGFGRLPGIARSAERFEWVTGWGDTGASDGRVSSGSNHFLGTLLSLPWTGCGPSGRRTSTRYRRRSIFTAAGFGDSGGTRKPGR